MNHLPVTADVLPDRIFDNGLHAAFCFLIALLHFHLVSFRTKSTQVLVVEWNEILHIPGLQRSKLVLLQTL